MNPTISLQFKQQLFFQAHSPLTSLLSSRFNPRLLYVDNLSSNMATIGHVYSHAREATIARSGIFLSGGTKEILEFICFGAPEIPDGFL